MSILLFNITFAIVSIKNLIDLSSAQVIIKSFDSSKSIASIQEV